MRPRSPQNRFDSSDDSPAAGMGLVTILGSLALRVYTVAPPIPGRPFYAVVASPVCVTRIFSENPEESCPCVARIIATIISLCPCREGAKEAESARCMRERRQSNNKTTKAGYTNMISCNYCFAGLRLIRCKDALYKTSGRSTRTARPSNLPARDGEAIESTCEHFVARTEHAVTRRT